MWQRFVDDDDDEDDSSGDSDRRKSQQQQRGGISSQTNAAVNTGLVNPDGRAGNNNTAYDRIRCPMGFLRQRYKNIRKLIPDCLFSFWQTSSSSRFTHTQHIRTASLHQLTQHLPDPLTRAGLVVLLLTFRDGKKRKRE
jgi:hypothetical protein